MQSDKIQEQSLGLVQSFTSRDPAQFDSTINQYFEANAIVESPLLRIHGSTRIKQLATLNTFLWVDSEIVGSPQYDEKSKTIHFVLRRTYKVPNVPFIGHTKGYLHWNARLHLHSDAPGASNDATFVVTKAFLQRQEKLPFEHLLPLTILRPVVSAIGLALCIITGFFLRHSFKREGLIGLLINAVLEAVGAVWMLLLGEKEKGMARVQKYTDVKDLDLPKLIGTAKSSAVDAASNMESRAQDVGIPVEDFKQHAYNALEEVKKSMGYLKDQLSATAGNINGRLSEVTGDTTTVDVPVEDTKKQAYDAIAGLGDMVGSVPEHRDAHDGNVNGSGVLHNSGEINRRISEVQYEATSIDDTPRMPISGDDQQAPHTISYADAASQ